MGDLRPCISEELAGEAAAAVSRKTLRVPLPGLSHFSFITTYQAGTLLQRPLQGREVTDGRPPGRQQQRLA